MKQHSESTWHCPTFSLQTPKIGVIWGVDSVCYGWVHSGRCPPSITPRSMSCMERDPALGNYRSVCLTAIEHFTVIYVDTLGLTMLLLFGGRSVLCGFCVRRIIWKYSEMANQSLDGLQLYSSKSVFIEQKGASINIYDVYFPNTLNLIVTCIPV